MKRLAFILAGILALLAYGCQSTMVGIETDVRTVLQKMEMERFKNEEDHTQGMTTKIVPPAEQTAPGSAAPVETTQAPDLPDKYSLTIQVEPRFSTVKILNIIPRYYPGIKLPPNRYEILVENDGYQSFHHFVDLKNDTVLKVVLNEKAIANVSRMDIRPADKIIPKVRPKTQTQAQAPAAPESGALAPATASVSATALPENLSGHTGLVTALCFSPDGRMLASGSYDGHLFLWDTRDWRIVHKLSHGDRVRAAAFSPDGRIIASAGNDKLITLWNTQTGKQIRKLAGHTDRVNCIEFSPDAKILVSGSTNELIIWEPNSGRIDSLIVGDDSFYPVFGMINTIAFHPTGKDPHGFAFAFTYQKGIALYNPATKNLMKFQDKGMPHSIAYSRDGAWLAWGARHPHKESMYAPRFVSVSKKEIDPARTPKENWAAPDRVFYTAFTPKNDRLIMISYQQAVLYDIAGQSVVKTFDGTSETSVTDAALSPDGQILAAASGDRIRLWRIAGPQGE